jgi:hypothetical protein
VIVMMLSRQALDLMPEHDRARELRIERLQLRFRAARSVRLRFYLLNMLDVELRQRSDAAKRIIREERA